MITTHQYINKYPISKESERIIIGTIHPHDHAKFKIPFFYGNLRSIWTILSDAFPDDLKKPITLERILVFLESKKIAVSDTILKCRRYGPSSSDKDLTPLELNHKLIDDIKNSNIKEIFFTSGFGKNNAFKLFYENILGLKITKEIKLKREFFLDEEFFGRPVKLSILYSPSGTSNVGLARSKLFLSQYEKYKDSDRPVYDFKVDYYREKLS